METLLRQLEKIPHLSDEKLLAAISGGKNLGIPFDYIEECKDELRRRGYSNEQLFLVMNEPEKPLFDTRKVILLLAKGCVAISVLTVIMLLWSERFDIAADASGLWLALVFSTVFSIILYLVALYYRK